MRLLRRNFVRILNSAGSAFLLRTRWVALFALKALRSPAPYAETFTCFCSLTLQKLS
ncbi:hypothetical protein [Campylobacter sp.]|uniref:hypothetical protein n=1 Tax=Campylobacter sp. TaxID=205 RepID=UPI002A81C90F|nr:hypothetical protein [Campylobacter sp.]MDY4154040.1 hypothetical protein [Campylobacter sp.]